MSAVIIFVFFTFLGMSATVPVDEPATPQAVPNQAIQQQPSASSVPADQGSGFITQHKNPDGSTLTITKFNGPLPASAFQSPFGKCIAARIRILSSQLTIHFVWFAGATPFAHYGPTAPFIFPPWAHYGYPQYPASAVNLPSSQAQGPAQQITGSQTPS